MACCFSSSACSMNSFESSVSFARRKCAAMLTYCMLAPNSWPIWSLNAFASSLLMSIPRLYPRERVDTGGADALDDGEPGEPHLGRHIVRLHRLLAQQI